MIRTGFFIALFFLYQNAFGQDAYDRYTNFYSVEFGGFASSSGLNIGPTFSVFRNRHKVDAGVGIKIYDVWKDGPGILATYLGYKFYPNQRKDDFNLYFGYHNIFSSHQRGKIIAQVCDELTDARKTPNVTLQLENMIGIGFDLQMGNQFYMFNDFSVGAVLNWNTYSDSKTELETRSTGMIRIGLGYTVGHKKAK
ncbi:MAG: hypothetical protein JKX84_04860 [Flavobacteriales bacterium]|nr:hypothetical protein [Flavobacteriales bacterium]